MKRYTMISIEGSHHGDCRRQKRRDPAERSGGFHRVGNTVRHACIIAASSFLLASQSVAAVPSPASRYTNITFEQISIDKGLSQSIVASITQDAKGIIWIGTEDGLNKYDGYEFTILRHDPENPLTSLSYNHILTILSDREGRVWVGTFNNGLCIYDPITGNFTSYKNDINDPSSVSHDKINVIFEDRDGEIWIGTDVGLNRFDRTNGAFVRYLHDMRDNASLSHNYILEISEDGEGYLWIGTNGGGLNRFDKKTGRFERYRNEPDNPLSLSHNSVRAVIEDREGLLWVGTVGGGLNSLDRDRTAFTRYVNDPDDPNSLSHDQIFSLYEDTSGMLWIGTNGGGLCLYERETGRFIRYRNDPNDPNSISYDEIYDIFEDRSGVIWLGTYGGGINKAAIRKFKHYAYDPNDHNSLSHPIVWSIVEDSNGVLWIGTHGGGLNGLDRRTGKYIHYRHDPDDPKSLSHDIVRIVYIDRSGIFWLGTNGGGVCRFDEKTGCFARYRHDLDDPGSLSHDQIRSIYEDKNGVLWIGTYGGGLNNFDRAGGGFTRYRFDPGDPSSLSNDYIRFMYEDSDGDFWIGTQGGGLEKFDRNAGIFTHFRADPSDTNSLSSDYVFSVLEDATGVLWIGTMGGGLNKFDKRTGVFKSYTESDGLSNNSVYGAIQDERGALWISTNYGLSRFDPILEMFKNYTEEDGLQSNEFNGNSYFKSESGELFFGGINGFNAFYPDEIRDNHYIPPVIITKLLKLNKEFKPGRPISEISELTFSHRDYVFSFEFSALDYTAPRKNKYAYKMEGLDDDWIYTTSNKRFATFTTLAPGQYRFMVKGSNNDGVWNNEGTSIAITITPPLWKTIWFRLASAIVIVAVFVLWYRRRLRTVRMAAELRAAHNAQMSIMPHDDPTLEEFDISGVCIPANEVGGDFYEYMWLDKEKKKFGVAVGDVSGKAMQAAMIAVMSSGMIYLKADETGSTAEIMTQLNRPLHAKTDERMFIALCLLSIDMERKALTFSNAGFNSPILKSETTVTTLESEGSRFPLGCMLNTNYMEKVVPLKRNDVVVIFSDGITEAMNQSHQFYEHERLVSLLENLDTAPLSAGQIKRQIIDDVFEFTGRASQNDDMTIVVVKHMQNDSTGERHPDLSL